MHTDQENDECGLEQSVEEERADVQVSLHARLTDSGIALRKHPLPQQQKGCAVWRIFRVGTGSRGIEQPQDFPRHGIGRATVNHTRQTCRGKYRYFLSRTCCSSSDPGIPRDKIGGGTKTTPGKKSPGKPWYIRNIGYFP